MPHDKRSQAIYNIYKVQMKQTQKQLHVVPGSQPAHLAARRVRVWLTLRARLNNYVYIKYCYVNYSIVLNDRGARARVTFFTSNFEPGVIAICRRVLSLYSNCTL